jgi:HD-GYP domain-containing protein (c-di-GMP phosphodiesterase class II)
MTVPVEANGAVGLYSAVGDAFAGRRLGFGRRRAALAARFARHRGGDDAAVAAAWTAGALAEIGLIEIVLPPDATPRTRLLALADFPYHGARLIAAIPGLPPRAADAVRWHREHDDGTGVPDRLRWDGIPADAAALGIAHAFVEAVEDPDEPRGPAEALFAIVAESGRKFKVELVRAFRELVTAAGDGWDAPVDPSPGTPEDAGTPLAEERAVEMLAARIDARDSETAGRSERLAAAAAALAARLHLDADRAARLARLLALGRATESVEHDDFDPLSRFARERRAAVAQRAAAIAASVPRYAGDAPLLAASAAWFEDGPADKLSGVLALVLAADGLDPLQAARRLGAAAGTQFDPDIVRAYLAAIGAPT